MTAAPSFQFYPKDFLGSAEIADLNLEEVGALHLLLCYEWNEVGLPKNLKTLAKLLRISERKMKKLWGKISKFFQSFEEKWRSPMLDLERERQAHRRAALSENGKKGGRPTKAIALPEKSKRLSENDISDNQTESLASSTAFASSTAVITTLPSGDSSESATCGTIVRNKPTQPKPSKATKATPWMGQLRAVLKRHYGVEPPGKWWTPSIAPLVEEHGIEAVELEFDAYCELTGMTYLNPPKFAGMFGGWANQRDNPKQRESRLSAGEITRRNLDKMLGIAAS